MKELMGGAEAISMLARLKSNIDANLSLPIRTSEMGLLILAVTNETPLTSIETVEFLKVSKPMIASMVNTLTKKGYLEKEAVPEDKRKFLLVPTDKARTLVSEAFDEYHKIMLLLRSKMGHESYLQMISMIEQANTILLEEVKNG